MDLVRDRISGLWKKTKKLKPVDWVFCLWFAVSLCFGSVFRFLFRDEIFGRFEILILVVVFVAGFTLSIVISVLLFEKISGKKFLLFLAAVIGIAAANFFPENFTGYFDFLRGYKLEIIDLDEGAEVELVWAYWADFPEKADTEIIDYKHFRDISFSQFEQTGTWNISEDGFLVATEKQASIRLKSNGLHFHLPVLCIKSKNGRALISETYNGKINFYALNGIDADPMPTTGFRYSFAQSLVGGGIFGLTLAGILAFLMMIAVRILKNPFLRLLRYFSDSSEVKKWYQRDWFIAIAAFLTPVVLLLVVCALIGVYPFGSKTFLRVDMNGQYVDFLAYLRSMASSKNDLFYSFSKNLGGEMYSLAAYYLNNPINYLVCLFSLEDLPKAVSFLVILRMGLCGLTGNFYLRRIGRAGLSSVIFSTAYALMTYNIVNAENIFFIDGVIFLPLVALGIEKIIEENRPFFYVLSLSAIMLINFYMGFMICIFAVLYFLYGLLKKYEFHSIPGAKRQIFSFIFGSLLSAGIAAIVLIPVYLQITSGPKYLDTSKMNLSGNFKLFDLISKNYTGAYDLEEYKYGLPSIYCGAIVTVFMILFFLNHKIRAKEKWLAFAFLSAFFMSFQIQSLNLVWHGFNPPAWWPFRYSFIFSFVGIMISWKSFLHRNEIRFRDIQYCMILVIGASVLCGKFDYPYLSIEKIYLEIFLICILCLTLYCWNQYDRKIGSGSGKGRLVFITILFLVSCGNLLLNTQIILKLNLGEAVTLEEFRESTQSSDEAVNEVKSLDNSFYRMEKQFHRTDNDALRNNYYSLSHYSSTTRQDELSFLAKLGINQVYYYTQYGEGSTTAVDSLLGVKYLLTKSENELKPYQKLFSSNGIQVYENPFALPIGFLISDDILYPTGYLDDLFIFQNQIFSDLTGHELGDIFTSATVNRSIDSETKNETWKIRIDNSDLLYTFFYSPKERPISVTVNNVSLLDRFSVNRYGVVLLGKFKPGDTIIMKFDNSISENYEITPFVYYENTERLQDYYEELSREPVDLHLISSSHLTGSFNSISNDQYIFFSIPYDSAWKILLDGKPVLPIKMVYDLMGVKAPQGEHQIELQYTPQGFVSGSIISAVSVIILMIDSLIRKNQYSPQKTFLQWKS